jgi:hypothetical protein
MGFVMEMFLLHVQNTVYSFLTAEYQIQDCLLVFTTNCMRLVALPSSYISSEHANKQNVDEEESILQLAECSSTKSTRRIPTCIGVPHTRVQ